METTIEIALYKNPPQFPAKCIWEGLQYINWWTREKNGHLSFTVFIHFMAFIRSLILSIQSSEFFHASILNHSVNQYFTLKRSANADATYVAELQKIWNFKSDYMKKQLDLAIGTLIGWRPLLTHDLLQNSRMMLLYKRKGLNQFPTCCYYSHNNSWLKINSCSSFSWIVAHQFLIKCL